MEGNEAAAAAEESGRCSGSSPSSSDSALDRNRKRRRLGTDSGAAQEDAAAAGDLPLALSRPVRNARLRSLEYSSYNMPSRRAKARAKSGKKKRKGSGTASISKILKPNKLEPDKLRRSTRNRRMSVLYDYTDESEEEDEIVGRTYHSKSDDRVVKRKSNLAAAKVSSPSAAAKVSSPSAAAKVSSPSAAAKVSSPSDRDRPRREGLRPRSQRVGRVEYSSQESAEDHETSDEDAEVGDEVEDEAESESGEDEDDEGEDGVAGEREADAANEGGDEDEDEDEEKDGKRRYELRNRAEVQRVLSPQKVFFPETETKHGRESGRSRPRKRRRREEDDSDDSLLVDEMDQAPGVSWARSVRGPQSFLPASLDVHGSTNWGLGIAASGWGHQGDSLGFGLAGTGTQAAGASSKGGADIQPVQVDDTVSFDQVGGLSHYIDSLKEMVFFPLLYPKFFESYRITPPRGVLLCGPPGTGKTLVARALASAAAKAGQKVNFYMRKGADVLSKWVGEAERQLRMLFEEAQRCQPSIIFFDEIDGLAPVRSSKSEQIHNSIVSTLLALMDGLDSRGQVVIIGATNRIDAIDGALRRPGRFDREFVFPLPDAEARAEILDIHTKGWHRRPPGDLRQELAASCVGYCGADLKALCTEAAIRAFRERYPQVYTSDEQFVIDADSIKVQKPHFYKAMSAITPAAHRGAAVHSRPLPTMLAPCLEGKLQDLISRLSGIFPLINKVSTRDCEDETPGTLASVLGLQAGAMFPMVYKPRFLLCGIDGSGLDHLGPALLHKLERFPVHSLGLPSLLSDPSAKTPEEALVHIFGEARRNTPSILYLPQLHLWWESAHEQLRTVLLMLLTDLPSSLPLLLLGTSAVPAEDLDSVTCSIFGRHIYEVEAPTPAERDRFFLQLINSFLSIFNQQVSAGPRKAAKQLPLPKAPKVDKGPSEAEVKAQAEAEDHAIRRLRMCLRDVCNRLLYEKRFSIFHFPVDADEVPNYHTIVQNPMDVATLLQRVDKGHYKTRSAFIQDVELIPANASQYHGEDYNSGGRIVSRACALRDAVQGMLSQMDPQLVAFCDKIASRNPAEGPPNHQEAKPATAPDLSAAQTRARARLRGIQPDLNLPPTAEKPVAANGSSDTCENEEAVLSAPSPARDSNHAETIADGSDERVSYDEDVTEKASNDVQEQREQDAAEIQAVTDLKTKFLLNTDSFSVSQLEMLYARLCRLVRVTQTANRSVILQSLQAFVDDEANFHLL